MGPRKAVLLMACLVLFSGSRAYADHPSGVYGYYGAGAALCVDYLTARDRGQDTAYLDWLNGYLTAYNRFGGRWTDTLARYEIKWMLEWLDRDCADGLMDPFAGAVQHLIHTME